MGDSLFDDDRRQRAIEALGLLDTRPDERVDRVTRLAQEIFGVPMVSVTLLDRDRQWRKSQIGLGGDEAPREGAFCDMTVRQGGTLIVEDASVDEYFATNPFVEGDPHLRFYAGHPLQAPGGEFVGTLCILDTQPRSLDAREVELLREMAQWVQTELMAEDDLDHATVVQQALLPRETPEVAGYTLAAAATASGQLMGDLYDWYLHDGRLRMTLADVMGKGTGPAIVAASVRASLRTAPDRTLAAAVAEVDRLLESDLGRAGLFVTAVHAELDPGSGRISFVDAGHSLAFILRRDGSWTPLRSTGLPLGMGFDLDRTAASVQLEPGDAFLCCSDGLLDILDEEDPFGHVLRVISTEGPDGAVAEAVRLAHERRAPDDVTVLLVRRDG
ncbi:GAF domain-containing SpoIIE family protein phosphatase [Microbacterium invictum]|uniref:GAF domain-containing SpoIIE family protein phosphatase n=1 Tax=Microbacterium invictum TaxID=515415 RepID=A0ABZ0VAN8_9MICO|nr:GAF domain-containing SpoIIE family protein phosphatase [Microbacterium invictum]WQB70204.1 GAF domain-containing SpoIIE family protein phosphatase [Microbacterium invictum]